MTPAELKFAEVVDDVLGHTAQQLRDKNAKYGDAYAKTEAFLRLLRPNGCAPENYGSLIFEVRAFDKMMRAATDLAGDDEDPDLDLLGYAALKVIAKERASRESPASA
jgi:hypothetical protein